MILSPADVMDLTEGQSGVMEGWAGERALRTLVGRGRPRGAPKQGVRGHGVHDGAAVMDQVHTARTHTYRGSGEHIRSAPYSFVLIWSDKAVPGGGGGCAGGGAGRGRGRGGAGRRHRRRLGRGGRGGGGDRDRLGRRRRGGGDGRSGLGRGRHSRRRRTAGPGEGRKETSE